MSFFTYVDRIIRQQSSPPATFTIAEDHLADGWEEGVERFLQPQESYFEIRLKQMYLRYQSVILARISAIQHLCHCLCPQRQNARGSLCRRAGTAGPASSRPGRRCHRISQSAHSWTLSLRRG